MRVTIMKELERLQAQVTAMQQQHNRLVLQIQQLEAKLRQLEGQVQAVPPAMSTTMQEALDKYLQSMHPTSAPHLPKPAWDQLLLVRDGSGSVELLGLHGQTTPVLDG
jgi:hypothetical protein